MSESSLKKFSKNLKKRLTIIRIWCILRYMRLRIVINLNCMPSQAKNENFLRMKSNMSRTQVVLIVTFLLGLGAICQAQGESIWERETLTNGFWGLNDELADSGIELGFGITNIYQSNIKGGTGTHNRRGRFNGSYDLETWADLQELLGFENGNVYMLVEGGWPDAEGIDAASVGSAFGVNADTGSNKTIKDAVVFGLRAQIML